MPFSIGRIRRTRPDCRCEGHDRIIERIGLAAEQDQVERGVEVAGQDGLGCRPGEIACSALDDQAARRQFCRASRADQEGHVAAGFDQPAPEIAADCSGADYEDAHTPVPSIGSGY
jgi:hypothetical protein